MNQAPSSTAGLHGTQPPSDWVKRWSHLIKPGGCVLDVACGYGRHARWFYERNHTLALVDWAQAAIDSIVLMRCVCMNSRMACTSYGGR